MTAPFCLDFEMRRKDAKSAKIFPSPSFRAVLREESIGKRPIAPWHGFLTSTFGMTFFFLCALCVFAAHFSFASPTTRPTQAVDPKSCVTPDCHPNIKSSRHLHGPVSVNACDSCHTLTSAAAHTYTTPRKNADLCTYCHEFDISSMPVKHKPAQKGECLGCHDPHGGQTHDMLKEKSIADLCARCHEDANHNKKFTHTPVAQGACDSCHPPHASRLPKLLDRSGSDLCLACHTEFDASLASAKFKHKALDQGCEKCHDAHASNEQLGLKQPIADLCTSTCHDHEKIKDLATSAQHKHSVVMNDRACLTCHTPHGGDLPKLTNNLPVTTCLNCHKDKVKTQNGDTLAAVTESLDPRLTKHGPIKDGQCGGCHAVHGGNSAAFLTNTYSPFLRRQFSLDNYQLCFSCHDVKLLQLPAVSTETKFRNGLRNLHYVHSAQGKHRETCPVCHATHAGPDRLVRTSVQYGVWHMPINFQKTPTGGVCTPGCHVPWAYDRDHPTTMPTTAPAALLLARSELEKPIQINMNLTTDAGQLISVPDSSRPTVLLLLNSKQSNTSQILNEFAAALGGDNPPQLLTILTGHATPTTLPTTLPSSIATLSDPDGLAASQLDVHGWPAILIIQSDGLELVRFTATPQSIALKLKPYLDLATGRIDSAALESILTSRTTVTDHATHAASRELQLARKYLDENKPEEAEKLLRPLAQNNPNDPAISAYLILALLEQQHLSEATAIFESLPPDVLDSTQHTLLQSRILIAAGQYDQAQTLLIDLLKAHPTLSEAHYLLATIHEHNNDYKSAAQEYRAAVRH